MSPWAGAYLVRAWAYGGILLRLFVKKTGVAEIDKGGYLRLPESIKVRGLIKYLLLEGAESSYGFLMFSISTKDHH